MKQLLLKDTLRSDESEPKQSFGPEIQNNELKDTTMLHRAEGSCRVSVSSLQEIIIQHNIFINILHIVIPPIGYANMLITSNSY